MTDDGYPRLLGDTGGTHARFAWQSGPAAPLSRLATLRCADHAALQDAMAADLAGQGDEPPVAAAPGIANPITGDQVRMTHHHWSRSIAALGAALDGSDASCSAALGHFFDFLGNVAGKLALTLGARGGVFICGGLVPRVLPLPQASAFRERFEAKGRFRDYLAANPVWVIATAVSPALLCASRALDADLASRERA